MLTVTYCIEPYKLNLQIQCALQLLGDASQFLLNGKILCLSMGKCNYKMTNLI